MSWAIFLKKLGWPRKTFGSKTSYYRLVRLSNDYVSKFKMVQRFGKGQNLHV